MTPQEIEKVLRLYDRARRIAQEENKDTKVIPLAERKPANESNEQAEETDFEAIARANKAKQEKLAKERAEANKKVLRSYRIKQ